MAKQKADRVVLSVEDSITLYSALTQHLGHELVCNGVLASSLEISSFGPTLYTYVGCATCGCLVVTARNAYWRAIATPVLTADAIARRKFEHWLFHNDEFACVSAYEAFDRDYSRLENIEPATNGIPEFLEEFPELREYKNAIQKEAESCGDILRTSLQ